MDDCKHDMQTETVWVPTGDGHIMPVEVLRCSKCGYSPDDKSFLLPVLVVVVLAVLAWGVWSFITAFIL